MMFWAFYIHIAIWMPFLGTPESSRANTDIPVCTNYHSLISDTKEIHQQYFVKGVAFKMVNIDERTEQSEIGGLLVFYHYLF